jgi:O-antigen/teichoic acid export membrane protein
MDTRDRYRKLLQDVKEFFSNEASRSASWLLSGGVLRAGIAFLANLALVRLLSPEDFGRFAIIQADISLVAAIVNFKTGPLIVQAPEEELEPYHLSRYTGALIVETLLIGGGGIITLWVLNLLTLGAVILLGSSLLAVWLNAEVKLYERSFEYKNITYIETTAHVLSHSFAVLGAFFGMGPLVLYLRKSVKQTVIVEGLRQFGALTSLPLRWLSLKDWKVHIRRLSGFWADGLLERIFDRVTVMILGALAGEETTGYFYQARRLAITPNQILRPFSYRMAFNYFSNRISEDRRYSMLWRGLAIEGGVLAIVAAGCWLLADPIIPWLFGEEWSSVVPMLIAMSGVIMGMPMFGTVQVYLKAIDRVTTFIAWGRGVQYSMIIIAASLAAVDLLNAGILLSIGLSAGFVGGTIASWGFTHYHYYTKVKK